MGQESKKILGKAAVGAAALGLFTFATCVEYVKPYEQGVKQVKISAPLLTGPQGYSQQKYPGGQWYWVTPVLETMHTFPRDLQVQSFSEKKATEEEQEYVHTVGRARIETPDTFHVDMDVDVFYKITDPYLTVTSAGPGALYKSSIIDKYTESGLKSSLGSYQPEDFFQVEESGPDAGQVKRIAAQKKAVQTLTAMMKPYGIEVKDVRIRQTAYVPEVQQKLEQKSEEDQRRLTNAAQAALSTEQGLYGKIREEGAQAAEVRKREGEAYRDLKAGELDAYKKAKYSEGDKLVQMANAEATRLQNEAYQGAGSELLVGLENAKNVCNLERIIWPVCGQQSNVLDLDAMTRMLSGVGSGPATKR